MVSGARKATKSPLLRREMVVRYRNHWLSTGVLVAVLVMAASPPLWAIDYSQFDRLENLNYKVVKLIQEGNFLKAVEPAEEALRLAKQIYADEPYHDNVEVNMLNLAVVYANLGRYDEAEKLFKKILAIDEQLLGPNDPEVARSLDNLADLYLSQGRHFEAERLYRRALTIREEALGPDHPATAKSRRNLHRIGADAAVPAEAEPAEKQAAENKRRQEAAKSMPLRTVVLRVAADEEFRRRDHWEKTIRDNIKKVSDLFNDNFRIGFEIKDIVTWDSDDKAKDVITLAQDLYGEVGDEGVDLVVGLSGQLPPATGEMKAGAALPLGSTALVSIPEKFQESFYPLLIAHEFSHVFGAWHVKDRGSLMYQRPTMLAFDEQTARVMNLMRQFDFQRGVDGIDDETKKELLNIFEDSGAGSEENPLTSAYTNLGTKLLNRGEYDEAVSMLQEALRLDPDHSKARESLTGTYNNLGIKLNEEGKYEEAIAVLRKAVDISPDRIEPRSSLTGSYINNGNALSMAGRLDDAVDAYREAIHFSPHDALGQRNLTAAYNNICLALGEQRKYEEAIAACRESFSINPTDLISYQNLTGAYVNQAVAFSERGELNKAIDMYREAIRIAPDDAKENRNLTVAYNNLGVALSQQDKLREAISAYRKSLRRDPAYANALKNLSSAYDRLVADLIKKEKYCDAFKLVREAQEMNIKLDPTTPAVQASKCQSHEAPQTVEE